MNNRKKHLNNGRRIDLMDISIDSDIKKKHYDYKHEKNNGDNWLVWNMLRPNSLASARHTFTERGSQFTNQVSKHLS